MLWAVFHRDAHKSSPGSGSWLRIDWKGWIRILDPRIKIQTRSLWSRLVKPQNLIWACCREVCRDSDCCNQLASSLVSAPYLLLIRSTWVRIPGGADFSAVTEGGRSVGFRSFHPVMKGRIRISASAWKDGSGSASPQGLRWCHVTLGPGCVFAHWWHAPGVGRGGGGGPASPWGHVITPLLWYDNCSPLSLSLLLQLISLPRHICHFTYFLTKHWFSYTFLSIIFVNVVNCLVHGRNVCLL